MKWQFAYFSPNFIYSASFSKFYRLRLDFSHFYLLLQAWKIQKDEIHDCFIKISIFGEICKCILHKWHCWNKIGTKIVQISHCVLMSIMPCLSGLKKSSIIKFLWIVKYSSIFSYDPFTRFGCNTGLLLIKFSVNSNLSNFFFWTTFSIVKSLKSSFKQFSTIRLSLHQGPLITDGRNSYHYEVLSKYFIMIKISGQNFWKILLNG